MWSKNKGYSSTVFLLMLLGLEYALKENRISEAEYENELKSAKEMIENLPAVHEDIVNWYEQNRERMIAVQKISLCWLWSKLWNSGRRLSEVD